MSSVVQVVIHASQWPDQVRRDRIESLRSRQVNHKFHYDSLKQTTRWLALHQAYSPSRTDPDCAAIYDQSFATVVSRLTPAAVRLIGLGCGGGQKDGRLVARLQAQGKQVQYVPCDVSTAMVLEAHRVVTATLPASKCFPLVCDLATAEDLPAVFDAQPGPADSDAARLITFFGMIPNFEPDMILPRLAGLLREGDHLLFSANLAPGDDYAEGLRRILPLYDNALTRDWLLTFLLDLGIERSDGSLEFRIEEPSSGQGLKRVAAYFVFNRGREIQVEETTFSFAAGEAIRLFFSYRHTPGRVCELLGRYGLRVEASWTTRSEEEGVLLVRRGARVC